MIIEYGLDTDIIVAIGLVILFLGLLYLCLVIKKSRHSKVAMAIEENEQLGCYVCPKCKKLISIYDINWQKNSVKTKNINYLIEMTYCPKCRQKLINKVVKSFWV